MKKIIMYSLVSLSFSLSAQENNMDFTDSPIVLDTNGASLSWRSGGSNGLALDCYCKIAPQVSGSSYSVFQRCRLTFSKDGLLTAAEILPERIRIQARNSNNVKAVQATLPSYKHTSGEAYTSTRPLNLRHLDVITESDQRPPPPQSFCGYTFGEVYTNNARVKLTKPFRYCNRAFISTTTNESRIYYIRIEGSSSGYMSNEDTQTELSRMVEIIEEKFGIRMTRNKNSYGYNDPSFKVSAHCWQYAHGSNFEITCTRKDIEEADAKSTRHGVQPLPPGVGSESL